MKLLSNEEISSLCLELSLLFHAGVGAGDALSLLAEESDKKYRDFLGNMARQVDDGRSLSQALRESGRFPAYVCGLVEVGERTGKTEEALSALSAYYENRVRLNRRLRSALLYPAVMLGLMLVVIAVLLIQVLPIFDDVYASLGSRLTGVAAGLLTVGRWLDQAMPVVWAVLALMAFFILLFAVSAGFRAGVLSLWRRSQGDRGVSKKLNTARLAHAKSRCESCRSRIERGQPLGEALRGSDLLPPAQIRLLELGQRSGCGDDAMAKIAGDLTEEGEAALDDMVGRVEPALVLVCSVLVGLILLSVMLPLMHIMSAIG